MKTQTAKSRQVYLAIGALVTWLALILQLYLILINRVTSVPETIIRFFSFYTILTNILVAVCFTVLLLIKNSRWGNFFSRATVVAAITLYISVVGATYNLILRSLWKPEGLQQIVDELLHVVVPLLFIFYWMVFAPKKPLQWKNVFPWLIYPLIYVILILLRGSVSGFYPYPFIDVNLLGYHKVFLNAAGLFCVFLILALLLVAITKLTHKSSN